MHHVNPSKKKNCLQESAKWTAAVKKKQNPGGSPTNFMKDAGAKKR
jgi:hypothetical protein